MKTEIVEQDNKLFFLAIYFFVLFGGLIRPKLFWVISRCFSAARSVLQFWVEWFFQFFTVTASSLSLKRVWCGRECHHRHSHMAWLSSPVDGFLHFVVTQFPMWCCRPAGDTAWPDKTRMCVGRILDATRTKIILIFSLVSFILCIWNFAELNKWLTHFEPRQCAAKRISCLFFAFFVAFNGWIACWYVFAIRAKCHALEAAADVHRRENETSEPTPTVRSQRNIRLREDIGDRILVVNRIWLHINILSRLSRSGFSGRFTQSEEMAGNRVGPQHSFGNVLFA